MQTSRDTRINRRRNLLTAFMTVNAIILLAIAVGVGVLVFRPAPRPQQVTITASQADKVAQAGSFLQDVGFNNPVYCGVTSGVEGKYPTFTVTAIGGKTVNVWIRTTQNGGWEIQPVGLFETVASADAFARLAQKAVLDWKDVSRLGIKPRTDGKTGEYETRKYMYEQLSQYNPDPAYWSGSRSETAGWPSLPQK